MKGRFGLTSIPGTRLLIILTAILFAVGMAFLGLAAALGDSHQTEEQKQIRWLTEIEIETIWTGSKQYGGLDRGEDALPIWRPQVVEAWSAGRILVDGYLIDATETDGWQDPMVITWRNLQDAGFEGGGEYDDTLSSSVSYRLKPDCRVENAEIENCKVWNLRITIITDEKDEKVEFATDYPSSENAGETSKEKGLLNLDHTRGEGTYHFLLGDTYVPHREWNPLPYKKEWAAELVATAIRLENTVPALWVKLDSVGRTDRYIEWAKTWLGAGLWMVKTFDGKAGKNLTPEFVDLYMADLAEVTADPTRYYWGLTPSWEKSLGMDVDNPELPTPCKEERYRRDTDNKIVRDEDTGEPILIEGDAPTLSKSCWKTVTNQRGAGIELLWPSPGNEGTINEDTGIGLPSGSLSR